MIEIEPGTGPENAPASAAAGLFTEHPLRYRFTGPGRAVVRTLDRVEVANLELRYAILPVFDDAADIIDGFHASAAAVDVLFDDGSRLLDEPCTD